MNVNGHVGAEGKAVAYKQIRCINLAKRGCFALNPEWYGMGELSDPGYSHSKLAYLDLVGVNGVSLFCLSMERGLDVLEAHPNTAPVRMGVIGLSSGAWAGRAFDTPEVTLCAEGPLTGVAARTAGALYPGMFTDIHAPDALVSFRDLLRDEADYGDYAPLFCFGILEVVDVEGLRLLSGN